MSVVAYHFWSPTCGPCQVIKPAVADLKEEFSHIQWVSVNTQEDPHNYTQTFGVRVVPSIAVVATSPSGEIVYRDLQSGTTMMNYYRILRAALRAQPL